jgi:hypothetical protein
MYLHIGDPDGVQEEHKRFILVRAQECPTSSGEEEPCIILHRNACSRGYKLVRERSSQVSRCVSVERSLVSRMAYGCLFSPSPLEWPLPSPFIDARGTQGYMHALRDVFLGKDDLRSPIVGGAPLLEEWLLSFDAVATCPVIRSLVNDAATTHRLVIIPMATRLSMQFECHREPRPRRHKSWRDFTPFEGIAA